MANMNINPILYTELNDLIPSSDAAVNGDDPKLSLFIFLFAPIPTRYWTTSKWPFTATSDTTYNGVLENSSCILTLASCFISNSTILKLPVSQALLKESHTCDHSTKSIDHLVLFY